MVRSWGIPNMEYSPIWQSKLPLEIKIFLWLVIKDKNLTRINLLKKDWSGSPDCLFCDQLKEY